MVGEALKGGCACACDGEGVRAGWGMAAAAALMANSCSDGTSEGLGARSAPRRTFSIRKPPPTTFALAMRQMRIMASAVRPPAKKSSMMSTRSPGLKYSVET
eukprot:scaffold828_cov103-Isochrysis_galbana.AAC.3